jgi:regulator of RNase E activity RraA
MVTGNGYSPPLDGDLLARLAQLDSPGISDALDRLGLRGVVPGIHAVTGPSVASLAGYAVTVRLLPRRDGVQSHPTAASAIAAARDGAVIVIDNQGRLDVSAWGGLLALAAQQRGARGVVVHGACRDVEELAGLGFPAFAWSTVPIGSKAHSMEVSSGDPVAVGPVTVNPGDLVRGDRTGLVFIPGERAAEIIEIAERGQRRGAAIAAALRAGRSITQARQDVSLPNLGEESHHG